MTARQTPEGRTKDRVRAAIEDAGAYFFMPVQQGFGRPTLDFLGARPTDGKMFAVETKSKNHHPTARQKKIMRDMVRANVTVFIIDDENGDGVDVTYQSVELFRAWLRSSAATYFIDPAFIK